MPKFHKTATVKHVKTDGDYVIVGTPDEFVLEGTREAAYAYSKLNSDDKRIFVRCQTEMEDGRFVPLNDADTPA